MIGMELGPYVWFIAAAYGAAAAVLGGVAAWLAIDGRRQVRLLDELEARGVRRRSQRDPAAPSSDGRG
jgi:heme exporter protein D